MRREVFCRLTLFAFYAFSAARIPSARTPSPRDVSGEWPAVAVWLVAPARRGWGQPPDAIAGGLALTADGRALR